jgi:hypothetical protein
MTQAELNADLRAKGEFESYAAGLTHRAEGYEKSSQYHTTLAKMHAEIARSLRAAMEE